MKITKDEMYPDIYGLYLYFLDKGYTSGLTRKDFKILNQLQNDLSWDLLNSSDDWFTLYKKIKSLIQEMVWDGIHKKYSDETIHYLKTNASLLPLVIANSTGKYKTDLVKMYSDNSYIFLCHFHNEKTPSMGVTDVVNLFNCFGCGYSGNPIDYLMECENLSYKTAIKLLAEIYLIDLKEKNHPTEKELNIIKKYQNAIISDEYLELLKRGQNRFEARNTEYIGGIDVPEFYKGRYDTIERIIRGEYDPNFVYKAPTQKVYLR